MIFHLQASGVPITWTILAVYKSAYGIAINAARHLHDQDGPAPDRCPHFVVALKQVEGAWTVDRALLLMDEAYLSDQKHDERRWLVQSHSAPFPLDEELKAALHDALWRELKTFGYLLPRAEWEAKYPAEKLAIDHYAAFSAAHDAHRSAHGDAEFPFELRWSPYMEAPEGFVFPYSIERQADAWRIVCEGVHVSGLQPATEAEAHTMARLLNSGYTLDAIPILMAA